MAPKNQLVLRAASQVVMIAPADLGRSTTVYRPQNPAIVSGCLFAASDAHVVLVLDEHLLARVDVLSKRFDVLDLATHVPNVGLTDRCFRDLFCANSRGVLLWETSVCSGRATSIPIGVSFDSPGATRVGNRTAYRHAVCAGDPEEVLLLSKDGSTYHLEVTNAAGLQRQEWAISVGSYSLNVGGVLQDGCVLLSDTDCLHRYDRFSGTVERFIAPGHSASVAAEGKSVFFMRGEGELWEWTVSNGTRLLAARSNLPRLYREKSFSRPPLASADSEWVLWWWEGPPHVPHTELINTRTGIAAELAYAHDACWLTC